MTSKGQRKTKEPCSGCYLHADFCMCAQIPTISLKTRLVLVVHAKELKRTSNTGRLAVKALSNSVIKIRGEGRESLDLTDLLVEDYRTVLFYPSEEAVELDPTFLSLDPRPVQLIVPDGNWRQASKVAIRHPELASVPRVKIKPSTQEKHFLRKEIKPDGMATLQAIAEALGVIEGDDVRAQLLALYHLKLTKTLQARGTIRPDDSAF